MNLWMGVNERYFALKRGFGGNRGQLMGRGGLEPFLVLIHTPTDTVDSLGVGGNFVLTTPFVTSDNICYVALLDT